MSHIMRDVIEESEVQPFLKSSSTFLSDDYTLKESHHFMKSLTKNEEPPEEDLTTMQPKFWPQVFGALSCAMVHMAIGCSFGFTGVTLPSLMDVHSEDLFLNKDEAALFSSIICIGAIGGSFLSSIMMTLVGQRTSLLLCLPLGMLSWIIMYVSETFWLLFLSRVIQGIVAGLGAACSTNYIVEISHASYRGALSATTTLFRQFGFLFVFIVGSTKMSWRKVSLLCGLTSMAFPFFTMIFLPNSPRWLATQNRIEEARKSLLYFRGSNYNVRAELKDIQQQLNETSKGGSITEQLRMITGKKIAPRFFFMSILHLLFHFTAGLIINMYAVTFFESAEVDIDPYLCTIILVCIKIVAVLIYIIIAERYGRRPMLIIPFILSGLALSTLGLFFYLKTLIGVTKAISWIPLASVICHSFFQMIVEGIFPTTRSELLPTPVRSVGVGILYIFFFLSAFSSAISYPYLVDSIGSYWTFWFYGLITFGLAAITCFTVPETRGKTLEEI